MDSNFREDSSELLVAHDTGGTLRRIIAAGGADLELGTDNGKVRVRTQLDVHRSHVLEYAKS